MVDRRLEPRDESILAAEMFVADVQIRLDQIMKAKRISRAELAERLGVRKSRVTAIFGSHSNITLETLGKILHALGEEGHLSTPTADRRIADLQAVRGEDAVPAPADEPLPMATTK